MDYESAIKTLVPEPKPWYQSKTYWFNGLVGAALIAEQAIPALQSFMTPDNWAIASAAIVLVNLVLRKLTTQPIEE